MSSWRDEQETKTVRRTWTYEVEVPAKTNEEALADESLEDRFMEAYTQGDGSQKTEVVS